MRFLSKTSFNCRFETCLTRVQAELPLNLLRVDARPAKVFRNAEQHRAIESMEGMLPWNGNHNCMIDRFDGRALLDFYKEPLPTKRKKTADEELLEEVPHFTDHVDAWLGCTLKHISNSRALQITN